ncbi:hypothetical protein OUZ56_006666 [Daphnia magna]|uniref:Uncharacterized protein n=1 Tax=Daphnia magna TaxID=35525 RepID=A0ABQ9YWB8_9CRUS|nr:hypothetical protein OUZ56_006666 [Daphnia magna]
MAGKGCRPTPTALCEAERQKKKKKEKPAQLRNENDVPRGEKYNWPQRHTHQTAVKTFQEKVTKIVHRVLNNVLSFSSSAMSLDPFVFVCLQLPSLVCYSGAKLSWKR